MKKIFTFAAALLATLSAMAATITVTVPEKTFTLPDLDPTWTWAGKVDNAYIVKGDTLVFNTNELYQSKSAKQPWYAAVGGGTGSTDWAAQGCFVGAAGWTKEGAKVNTYATVKNETERLYFYRVTNCNGAMALVKSGSNKKRTIYLEAYELTEGVAAATPAFSDSWEEAVEHIISISGLDVTKEYVIALYAVGTGTGGASNGNSNVYEVAFIGGPAATKYTVSYMDGETVLGTEKVKEGETAKNASLYEAKPHATFNGWYNDNGMTVLADFSAPITSDKAFYGKWTADAFVESTSLNIEQGVLDYSKAWDIKGALTAAHIAYKNIDALDSLAYKSETDNNEAFLGLKLKTAGAYVEMGVGAGHILEVKFGNVAADVKINGNVVSKSELADPYRYTAMDNEYVRVETTTGGTVVLKQINILTEIKASADLSSIKVNGNAIAGFKADSLDYTYMLPYGTIANPEIVATAVDPAASVVIDAITSLTQKVNIVVTSGELSKTYTIQLGVAEAPKDLFEAVFSNGAKASIYGEVVEVAYMGTKPTLADYSVSEGATATIEGDVITIVGEDKTTRTLNVTFVELTAPVFSTEEVTFTGTEAYVYGHYGWDADKGWKFAKAVNDAGNMRIAEGKTRVYMALPACKAVKLISGTGGARDVKIYVNNVESSVTKTAAGNASIRVELDDTQANFVAIESNQTKGDGGFIGMILTNEAATAIQNTTVGVKAQKRIVNGQLVIEREGVRYNAVGTKF